MLPKENYVHLARLRGLFSHDRSPQSLANYFSLLLLHEFHPRSMHFPPRDDDDEILAPADDDRTKAARPTDSLVSSGESTMFNWSEPALRSDRMCWSLIGTSYVLAFELGIFGTYSEGALATNRRVMRHGGSPEFNRRADRIERLLYIFIIQAAGRFGLPSMYGADVNRFASASFEDSSLLGTSEDKINSNQTG